MSEREKISAKKSYSKPELLKFGTVADLTKTGQSYEGGDAKIGSALSKGR